MKINVIIDAGFKKQASPAWLRKIARLALAAEKAGTNVEMGIVITGDAEIHELNREYLDEDHPTDVLSFPMLEADAGNTAFIDAPDGTRQLGEVIISYPQAEKQAKEHAHSIKKEIAVLLIHGILHLLGHDHDIPGREKAMHKREAVILQTIEETR